MVADIGEFLPSGSTRQLRACAIREQLFATKYHSIASIQTAVEWIMSSDPEPPEVMARRITLIRKISLSDTLFGKDCKIYDIEE